MSQGTPGRGKLLVGRRNQFEPVDVVAELTPQASGEPFEGGWYKHSHWSPAAAADLTVPRSICAQPLKRGDCWGEIEIGQPYASGPIHAARKGREFLDGQVRLTGPGRFDQARDRIRGVH